MWAYVVDTGVNTVHTDFEGRAFNGYNAYPNSPFTDVNGHGTHCAGTIAGRIHGVAKKANVMAVKVFHDGGVSQLLFSIEESTGSLTLYSRRLISCSTVTSGP